MSCWVRLVPIVFSTVLQSFLVLSQFVLWSLLRLLFPYFVVDLRCFWRPSPCPLNVLVAALVLLMILGSGVTFQVLHFLLKMFFCCFSDSSSFWFVDDLDRNFSLKLRVVLLQGLFEKWSTLDPKNFHAIPFKKLVFLVSLYPEFSKKIKEIKKLFFFRLPW